MHVDADIAAAWEAYKRAGDRPARDELILHYAPLVHIVAARLAAGAPSHVDRADLVSYGVFGLIDAIEKFEPERGHRFETYAMARIRGHIVDELRSFDWVPRSVRAKARAVDEALSRLEAELHREPTDSELAEALGLDEEELRRVLAQVALINQVTFDTTLGAALEGDQGLTLGDVLVADEDDAPGHNVEVAELRAALAAAIERLSARERDVVALYYHDGLTLAEIGEVLGVTESRVCQIHGKAVAQLRRRLVAAERELA
ncbi:MAG TPA: FliA/WhiG family RNA polymerase sigma factor [Acidimicrobiales bacterium]|jgi:RNA polymerase sigma factor for flagellar operon FliA|nr:FliA/WhiG family RNA polymerase sigma factor [Acidimicrobiales bacterium]